jgi:hypothetical protein
MSDATGASAVTTADGVEVEQFHDDIEDLDEKLAETG